MQRTTLYIALLMVFLPSNVNTRLPVKTVVGEPVATHAPYKLLKPLPATQFVEQPELAPIAVQPVQTPPATPSAPVSASYTGSGDADLDWIIAHESGGNPYAMNPSGACGLGQSLPCSKVLSRCGSLDNVSCQVEWVRDYCVAAYGSTSAARAFWQVHSWY